MDNLDKLIKENKSNDEISEKVNKRVEATLDMIMKEGIKEEFQIESNNKKRFNFRRLALIAGLALIISVSLGAKYNVYAKVLDLLKSFEEKGETPEKIDLYSKILDKKVYDSGYSVSIENIISDSHTIRIFYNINSDKTGDQKPGIWGNEMKIDDKDLVSYGGISSEEYLVQDDNKNWSGNMLVMRVGKELPKTFNFKWNIYNISNSEGKWNFDINVNSEELAKDTKTIDVNKGDKLDIGDFNIKNITLSPIELDISSKEDINDKENPNAYINYIVLDENNKLLSSSSNYGMNRWINGDNLSEVYYGYKLNGKIPSKIKIIPYEISNDSYNTMIGKSYTIGSKDVSLYKGESGSLNIESIEDKGDYVEVAVNIEGYLRGDLLDRLLLVKNDGNNSKVSNMNPESRKIVNQNINNEKFVLKFNKYFGKDKNYHISFNVGNDDKYLDNIYKIYEDKVIEVDLSK
ncbi:DUF4179 domain-containing protein [Clostridium sp. YIM B02551]|uniref:DUF4179 domain-containing protein n=1 Tax=Clostridium sp. YIM B02551 TaxID=2910679 RepID=UPI001EECD916|nr:DUF4179 domain-containing protein [Clostridium sp. YIM B02551]